MQKDFSLYSQNKALWHSDRLDALRKGETPKPVHVQLILSDLCNQDCHFCAYRMSAGLSTELFKTEKTHNPNRKMPTEKAIEILDDCAEMGVKAIQFTGGGEPTVHKDCLEIFAHAQKLGLQTALVTNGIKLDPTHPAIQNMTWIRISIDAGCEETYMSVRRVTKAHWAKLWNNIGELQHYDGVLGAGFVITPDNYTEIPMLAKRCKLFGINNMRVGAVFSSEGIDYYHGDIERITEVINKTKHYYDDDGFEVIDLFGRRLSDLEHGTPDHSFCGYQYFTLYIGGDMNVYRCCTTAYTLRGKLGSLRNARFRDIKLDYEPFDARKCNFCQFLGQNQAINELIEKPTHVDFV